MQPKSPLAGNIKRIRQQLRLSIEEFAIDMDVNTSKQRIYERGLAQPDEGYLKRLAHLVSLNPDALNEGDTAHQAFISQPPVVHPLKVDNESSDLNLLREENDRLRKKVAKQQLTIMALRRQLYQYM